MAGRGGWKAASGKLMTHAIREVNVWIRNKKKLLEGAMDALVVSASYGEDSVRTNDDVDDGVDGEIAFDEAGGGDDGEEGEFGLSTTGWYFCLLQRWTTSIPVDSLPACVAFTTEWYALPSPFNLDALPRVPICVQHGTTIN